ncbi:hypothetical protein FOA52_006651 [Chlamydomonas sp. UWO 241]|nr:hypothetical protein FOA52_006651 [Chlamydomonas sp. UWO 241]
MGGKEPAGLGMSLDQLIKKTAPADARSARGGFQSGGGRGGGRSGGGHPGVRDGGVHKPDLHSALNGPLSTGRGDGRFASAGGRGAPMGARGGPGRGAGGGDRTQGAQIGGGGHRGGRGGGHMHMQGHAHAGRGGGHMGYPGGQAGGGGGYGGADNSGAMLAEMQRRLREQEMMIALQAQQMAQVAAQLQQQQVMAMRMGGGMQQQPPPQAGSRGGMGGGHAPMSIAEPTAVYDEEITDLDCILDDASGGIVVTLQGTPIVSVTAQGAVTLSTGGWWVNETVAGMNRALQPINMKVVVEGDPEDGNWTLRDGAKLQRFGDDMTLPPRGQSSARAMAIYSSFHRAAPMRLAGRPMGGGGMARGGGVMGGGGMDEQARRLMAQGRY